ncbi:SPFH domain / band 7 family protein [Clostridium homopropionicum DSM 5847]|uniref:SPFH domain / band 7 family protein n=1 Tax=Clostridium homopropionicum DSM 5847 TaxID=1121318 RepID=A0A0L6Z6R8_9CLOT|nr:SPFH domain-containing protein [Clostridium homopropionicum]KOA18662.1 SPFH domain / band 7 family protein [Clostridium homopropionicum DSM 5847]SFG51826.1 SPFH domain / Band 7 family protein [Clostridium homopropionicum]
MSDIINTKEKQLHSEEIELKAKNGMAILLLNITLMILSVVGFVFGIILVNKSHSIALPVILIIVSALYFLIVGPILFAGLKVLKPNEALVLTFFGKYYGTLKGEGFFFVNPFVTAVNPATSATSTGAIAIEHPTAAGKNTVHTANVGLVNKKISLKAMTLNNDKQKINDQLGNPIIIGIVVIWKVVNTAKAVFNVDNYTEYLSIQCDSALRNIVRLYPYDASSEDNEKSLRGSSQEIAEKIKAEIQSKVEIAGLEILEARITHLAYAPEIAAVMLQRQQASAIIDARQMIVEGAVGMVEMALSKLNENDVVHLDEERKAAMVSNLLVVLCGNKDAQPIVNSGSIY